MNAYESRDVTLDPGLTALALRGLYERDGHYPFVEQGARRRRSARRSTPIEELGWLHPFINFLARASEGH